MNKGKSKISYWLTASFDRKKERFVMKGYSFYEHPAVRGLSSLAYKLYDYMCKECGGARDFYFPVAKYKDMASRPSFQRARNELIEKGFLILLQNNANLRKPNLYRFSDEWKKRDF